MRGLAVILGGVERDTKGGIFFGETVVIWPESDVDPLLVPVF